MLQNYYLLVQIGFDTAESDPFKAILIVFASPGFWNTNIACQGPFFAAWRVLDEWRNIYNDIQPFCTACCVLEWRPCQPANMKNKTVDPHPTIRPKRCEQLNVEVTLRLKASFQKQHLEMHRDWPIWRSFFFLFHPRARDYNQLRNSYSLRNDSQINKK